MNPRWTDMLGGRKFILAVLAMVFVTFFTDLSGEAKVAFIATILGMFSAVNSSTQAAYTAADAAQKLASNTASAAETVVSTAKDTAADLVEEAKK